MRRAQTFAVLSIVSAATLSCAPAKGAQPSFGAVERGRHYLDAYPGFGGWLLALACTGVVFVAGGKLLDSVKTPRPALAAGPYRAPVQRHSGFTPSRRTTVPARRGPARRFSGRSD